LSTPRTDHEDIPDQPYAKWLGATWTADAHETHQTLGKQPVDWLVVDHYSLDGQWERTMRPLAKKIMVIDDLADRKHDCDLLLDQNLGRTERDYEGLINARAKLLIGPDYALIRPEFAQVREYSMERRREPKLRRLLVSMGGVDLANITSEVIEKLKSCPLPLNTEISIVMGKNAPWLQRIQTAVEGMPWRTKVLIDVDNIAPLMAESDLAIGAAGGSAWERCAVGLPSIILIAAQNQIDGARALHRHGAAIVLEKASEIPSIVNEILPVEQMRIILKRMSHLAAELVSGHGTEKVTLTMTSEYA
jgi:UDP-2,4-diacetamido-2,4,6-trideoxy-beta-L-altropyranose hydrolase